MLWYASFMSTHDRTSQFNLPNIWKMSHKRGVALLHLCMLSSRKCTIGLLALVTFWVISMTGEHWLRSCSGVFEDTRGFSTSGTFVKLETSVAIRIMIVGMSTGSTCVMGRKLILSILCRWVKMGTMEGRAQLTMERQKPGPGGLRMGWGVALLWAPSIWQKPCPGGSRMGWLCYGLHPWTDVCFGGTWHVAYGTWINRQHWGNEGSMMRTCSSEWPIQPYWGNSKGVQPI